MATKEQTTTPNLKALAEEALDLWQDYLDSCASDPKTKAEFSQIMAPMNQMFAPWASFMQQSMHGIKNTTGAKGTRGGSAKAADADGASSLERRVVELESRVAELESYLAKIVGAASARR